MVTAGPSGFEFLFFQLPIPNEFPVAEFRLARHELQRLLHAPWELFSIQCLI